MSKFSEYIKGLVNLSDHIDHEGAALSIRKNIPFRGPNVIILACAIVIASVGLNVNSIPVIIGAMLISPVMGPILGFGFGLGTQDSSLVRDSMKNFAVMVTISILASTIYFLLSPLTLSNPSELLARTKPSIYDVLIALFGGFAGMLEISRREKGTVLSGVAIATALMPPLCTIGYGLSILNFRYVAGALYLFIINSIFIALATFLTVKYLRYPLFSEESGVGRRLKPSTVAVILVIFIVPSIFSAVRIVRENRFSINAERVVSAHKSIDKGFIYDYKVDLNGKSPQLEIFLAGEALSPDARERIFADAESHGIKRSQVLLHEDAASTADRMSDSEIVKGIYERSDQQMRSMNETITDLQKTIDGYKAREIPAEDVSKEMFAQYPTITDVVLSRGSSISAETGAGADQVVAIVTSSEPLGQDVIERLERWLCVRLSSESVFVVNKLRD